MSIDILVRFLCVLVARWRGAVVVHEDAMRRALHVFELPTFYGPEKHVGNNRHEDQAERDEEVKDVHESGGGDFFG